MIAAQALLDHGMSHDAVLAYIRRSWALDPIDALAAVEAAHTLSGHDHGVHIAARSQN